MTIANRTVKYAIPRAEEFLRIVNDNIVGNLRMYNEAKITVTPLVQRAYTIVNETGVLPYRDYAADARFLGE